MLGTQEGVIVMAVELTAKVRRQVEARDAAGLCLICESKAVRRGLCWCHYQQFRSALQDRPKRERPGLEARMIQAGKVIDSRPGQRRDVVNVFRQFATE